MIKLIVATFIQLLSFSLVEVCAEEKFDQSKVESKCMDVFNKTHGMHIDEFSTCPSRPGVNTSYQFATDFWKVGVRAGIGVGLTTSGYNGASDAEIKFKSRSHEESVKWQSRKERAEGVARFSNGEVLTNMPGCFRTDSANDIIESAKFCGQGVVEALLSEDYQTEYEKVCLSQIHNSLKCEKLSKQAYFDYLLKKGNDLMK